MSRMKIDKGQEFRPRLHDGMEKLTHIGRFVLIKMDSPEAAEKCARQPVYIRPDRKKSPVRIA